MKKIVMMSMLTVMLATACTKDDDDSNEVLEEQEELVTEQSELYTQIETTILAFPEEELDHAEQEGLLLMREEEKLARDVYEYLYNRYEMKIFTNIMGSEETHMFAVKIMLDKYEIDDPADSSPPGVFENSTLQKVYNDLIEKGDLSLTDALIVGTIIEDLDIHDLNHLLESTSNQDLIYVYENLNLGSRNHLRAFYPQVLNNNGEYDADYISQEEFDEIIASSREFGTW
jgi:hypothetical protein